MRFLKRNLFAAVVTGIMMTFSFSSCERNVCDNVSCDHGGSCNSGLCVCPTGYEGPRCEDLMSTRYLGMYTGYTACNNTADVFDTVTITQATKGLLYVDIDIKSLRPKVLHGYVQNTTSAYTIIVTNNDTTKTDSSHYYRTFTISLQSDKLLNINKYEEFENPTDTVISKCNFLSQHKL